MNLDALFIQAGLFNQRSTENQQKKMIGDILKKKLNEEGLDS